MAGTSRRNFLIGGAVGLAAATLPISRWAKRARAGGAGDKRNLILIMAGGGWDVTYALDPKPGLTTVDAPAGQIQTYGDTPIFVHESRPSVGAFFERYGANTAVLNGVQVQSIAHLQCRRRMLTGSRKNGAADLGAITAHSLGRELPVPYMVFGNTAFPGPLAGSTGRVGITNQIKALLSGFEAYPPPPGSPAEGTRFVPGSTETDAIRDYVQARAERVRATRGQLGYNRARIDDFVEAMGRGDALKPHVNALGPRGITLGLAEQSLFAVEALATGVAHSVLVEDPQSWDTHTNNAQQGALHEQLFAALTLLMDTLATRDGREAGNKMIDETVVMVLSEMSRTPRLNGGSGKDHWPSTSCMVMGSGVAGNRAYGGTDDNQSARLVDLQSGQADDGGSPLMAENVIAAVLSIVGVSPATYLPDVEPLHALIA